MGPVRASLGSMARQLGWSPSATLSSDISATPCSELSGPIFLAPADFRFPSHRALWACQPRALAHKASRLTIMKRPSRGFKIRANMHVCGAGEPHVGDAGGMPQLGLMNGLALVATTGIIEGNLAPLILAASSRITLFVASYAGTLGLTDFVASAVYRT